MRMSSSVGRLGKAGVQGSSDIAEVGASGAGPASMDEACRRRESEWRCTCHLHTCIHLALLDTQMLHKPRWTDWGHGDDVFCDQILYCKGVAVALITHSMGGAEPHEDGCRSAFHLLFWKNTVN